MGCLPHYSMCFYVVCRKPVVSLLRTDRSHGCAHHLPVSVFPADLLVLYFAASSVILLQYARLPSIHPETRLSKTAASTARTRCDAAIRTDNPIPSIPQPPEFFD